jgi:thioredoxin-related protein
MIRPLRNLLAVVLLALAAAVPAHAQDKPQIQWLDWDAGIEQARATGKPILVDVYTDWCGWCKRMDRDVYARPEIREFLTTRYVTVKLDAEASDAARYQGKNYSSSTLAERFKVTSYPTTIFLRANGDHILNVPGYVPADRFLLVLRYIGEGHLDRGVNWEAFSRQESTRPPAAVPPNALRAR